jgi:hypothetical protein
VIDSPYWDNGPTLNAGAVTFCSGTSGCKGTISAANSLLGVRGNYHLGYGGIEPVVNNDYLVISSYWPSGAMYGEGNLAWCDGTSGCLGSSSWYPRSAYGSIGEGSQLRGVYDAVNNQVLVGRPEDNIVTILGAKIEYLVFLPMVKK